MDLPPERMPFLQRDQGRRVTDDGRRIREKHVPKREVRFNTI